MYSAEATYFVTARTIQSRMLLAPTPQLNAIVGGVLARALERYDVELHGYVVLSNHLHLLCHARNGQLSRFMQYVLGNIARKAGRLVSWTGAFWERRFSAEEVLDDEAALDRLRYLLAHGVKEGLVRRVSEWPGLHCAAQLLDETPREFFWYSWSAAWRQRTHRAAPDDAPFALAHAESVALELTPLPSLSRLAPPKRVAAIRSMIQGVEDEGRRQHSKVPGARAVSRVHPHTRPERTKRGPRPVCHATRKEAVGFWRLRYRDFVSAYRTASAEFRRGNWSTEFPSLAFRPPCLHHLEPKAAA